MSCREMLVAAARFALLAMKTAGTYPREGKLRLHS